MDGNLKMLHLRVKTNNGRIDTQMNILEVKNQFTKMTVIYLKAMHRKFNTANIIMLIYY